MPQRFAMPQRKRLGEVLVDASIITQKQVEEALQQQKEQRRLFGQILVERRDDVYPGDYLNSAKLD